MKKILLLALIAMPVFAQNVPMTKSEITLSFSPVVKKTAPSVVNVYASKKEQINNPLRDDPFWGRFFQNQPREQVQRSLGSGVIVEGEGLIITNNHVIQGMTDVKIALADKREFEAEILLRDPRTDLAVLKIKGLKERLTQLELGDSDKLEVGDLVLALGNPFGVGQTVTQGIVSALARSQVGVGDYQSFIQTDAAINPGNSGGALVDMAGRLVGINTAIFSKSGGSHGIGFAIPVGMVKVVLLSAKAGSKVVRRPWIGMKTESVTPEIAENLGLLRPAGVLINFVRKASPAERAGLKSGDVITAIDGIAVDEPDAFGYRLAIRPAGFVMALTVLRDGKPITINITTQAAPKGPEDLTVLRGESPLKGATVQTISPSLEEELGIDIPESGVVIVAVDGGALQTGLQKGDVILSLNGEAIISPVQLDKITSARSRLWRLEINRGGQILRSVFGG